MRRHVFRVVQFSLRTPQKLGQPQTCGVVHFFGFRDLHRRFPCQDCVRICFSRTTESSTVGSVLQRTHPCARIGVDLLGSRRLTRASVSKKGEAKRGHTKWPDSSGGVTRWPRQHCAQSSPRVGAVLVCRACFLNNRQEIIVFEVSPLWSIWNTRRAASHCPRWNALMLPRFHFVDCGLYSAGFEAAIIVAQLFLFQRHKPHEHFTCCTPHRALDEYPHSAHHLVTSDRAQLGHRDFSQSNTCVDETEQ